MKQSTGPSPDLHLDLRAHWDSTYERRGFSDVSWFQAEPWVSLAMIRETGIPPEAAVIDVGGGASPLLQQLIGEGFRDLSLLDVSSVAVQEARQRLPADAPVDWIVGDVLSWQPARRYDLWHDRAVFHFLTLPSAQDAYRQTLTSAVAPGGFVVIGTFAADGPQSCSGLPVARYSEPDLASALGPGFTPVAYRREEHQTPSGSIQPFTWICARVAA